MSQRKVGGGSKKSGFSALVIICFQKEQFPPELASEEGGHAALPSDPRKSRRPSLCCPHLPIAPLDVSTPS